MSGQLFIIFSSSLIYFFLEGIKKFNFWSGGQPFFLLFSFLFSSSLRLRKIVAAPSSSKSLVVGRLVRPSVCWSVEQLCEKVTFRVSNGNLKLPLYLPMQQ